MSPWLIRQCDGGEASPRPGLDAWGFPLWCHHCSQHGHRCPPPWPSHQQFCWTLIRIPSSRPQRALTLRPSGLCRGTTAHPLGACLSLPGGPPRGPAPTAAFFSKEVCLGSSAVGRRQACFLGTHVPGRGGTFDWPVTLHVVDVGGQRLVRVTRQAAWAPQLPGSCAGLKESCELAEAQVLGPLREARSPQGRSPRPRLCIAREDTRACWSVPQACPALSLMPPAPPLSSVADVGV